MTASTAPSTSAWAPLRNRLFAAMWTAQFISNVGGWMQVVAAQWLMLTLTASAAYVAIVQTASSLPVVVFAVLAGTIGDLVDRRRLLLITQVSMLLGSTLLGVLAIKDLISPWTLLALVFVIGTGQALTAPTWQTLQPELVPPAERTQAISLGAVNQNLARAVGPALGGAVLAAAGAGPVFLVNAATFLAVIAVIYAWHSTPAPRSLPREHVAEAVRAGTRYVVASPALRAVLVRAGVFILFASSLWALLPIVARSDLHLGSGGYGLLLGAVGVGAVVGAGLLPRLRTRRSPDALLAVGSIGMAAIALVVGYIHVTVVVGLSLAVAGTAWILSLSTLNSLYQLTLPSWIKARGLAFYLIVFQGGNAVGSAVMGILAEHIGVAPTLVIAAAGLVLAPLLALRYRFQTIPPDELLPAGDWPEPHLVDDESPSGPAMVSVEYRAQPGREAELLAALRGAKLSRRRTGASSWRAWRDSTDPARILEEFVVASWAEHLRQHEHVTVRDQQRLDEIRDLTDPASPPVVTHWLTPR